MAVPREQTAVIQALLQSGASETGEFRLSVDRWPHGDVAVVSSGSSLSSHNHLQLEREFVYDDISVLDGKVDSVDAKSLGKSTGMVMRML